MAQVMRQGFGRQWWWKRVLGTQSISGGGILAQEDGDGDHRMVSIDRSGLILPNRSEDKDSNAGQHKVDKEQETELVKHLQSLIQFRGGPLTIAEYMSEVLTHPTEGYYTTREHVFGSSGDFVTSPDISQMFGEMIGIWCVAMWQQLGCPKKLMLAELGPGKGTLMADVLRGTAPFKDFNRALEVHLVEVSPRLRSLQAESLGCHAPSSSSSYGPTVTWWSTLDDVPSPPDTPVLYIGHEFLDALPIHQFIFTQISIDICSGTRAIGGTRENVSLVGASSSTRQRRRGHQDKLEARTHSSALESTDFPLEPSDDEEDEQLQIPDVARQNLENAWSICKRYGWISFWFQMVLTVVAGVIILFSMAFTSQQGPQVSLYLTLFGVVTGFLSTFWSFVRRSDVINMLEKGAIINILGAGASVIGLQATIGLLVAKTLTTATVNPFLASNTNTWNPVLAFDVFNVQATTNTLLSHFFSLIVSLWLLRRIANRPSAARVAIKKTPLGTPAPILRARQGKVRGRRCTIVGGQADYPDLTWPWPLQKGIAARRRQSDQRRKKRIQQCIVPASTQDVTNRGYTSPPDISMVSIKLEHEIGKA
eukprot:jgi/Picre1/34708/NNA_002176.t1